MNSSLRIAFLLPENGELPAWEYEMLKQLLQEEFISVVGFIKAPLMHAPKMPAGYRLFRRFEDRWFRSMPDAFKSIDALKEFNTIPVLIAGDTGAISSLQPDIIYCSWLATCDNAITGTARYGTWFVQFGNQNSLPPAFPEVMNKEAVTSASLVIRMPGSTSLRVAYEGTISTVPFSVKNNLNSIAWKAATFLPYRLKELSQNGASLFFEKHNRHIDSAANPRKAFPGNLKMAGLFLRNVLRYLRSRISDRQHKENFNLFFSLQPFDLKSINLKNFQQINGPVNSFWADPFVIEKEEGHYIFFEELPADRRKAHISMIEYKGGVFSNATKVLERPYHISYPFVWEWNGNYYMIPETGDNQTVELYRAKQFPGEWEFVMNLIENVLLFDPTLVFENGKWWLFGTTRHHDFSSTNDQLLLYYSDTFLSKNWILHPQSPVATDVANCRPAGSCFRFNGELYRPAQNSSKRYGYGITINRIEVMNETQYRETPITHLLPSKESNLEALHTLNFTAGLIVIDGVTKK